VFDFQIKHFPEPIKIEILDKDPLKSDLIAEATLSIDSLIKKGGVFEWFKVSFKDESAGQLQLQTKWVEAG
jgi:hypothetical protein